MLTPETALLNVIDVQGKLAEIVADSEDVRRNIVRLIESDYEVHLVVDAVSSRSRTNKEVAIRRMEREGALLTTTEMALFELKFDCRGETFRKLSKLVKWLGSRPPGLPDTETVSPVSASLPSGASRAARPPGRGSSRTRLWGCRGSSRIVRRSRRR